MRRFFVFTVAIFVVLAALGLSTGRAVASCAAPVPLDQAIAEASNVFVGTVAELRFDDRFAVFDVEDVWKGDLPDRVEVNGGPSIVDLESAGDGVSVATSVDRTYRLGERYLVVSHGLDQDVLADNACSATREYADDLVDFRPADAHAPTLTEVPEEGGPEDTGEPDELTTPADPEETDEPDELTTPADPEETDDDSTAAWWLAGAALLGAGGVGAMVLWRRRANGGSDHPVTSADGHSTD